MNDFVTHPIFQDALDLTQPRHVRQLDIETRINNLRPDFSEAEEILYALSRALQARYDHALLDDINHYAEYLGKALERAELEQ